MAMDRLEWRRKGVRGSLNPAVNINGLEKKKKILLPLRLKNFPDDIDLDFNLIQKSFKTHLLSQCRNALIFMICDVCTTYYITFIFG